MALRTFTREDIESAFAELGKLAHSEAKVVDLAVFGGVAMMLTFPARPATHDVDAVALSDGSFIRKAVQEIAASRGWPDDWLNDAVKGFLSPLQREPDSLTLFRTYPSEQEPGLRVFVARPEYLLAMKCIAMRIDTLDAAPDIADIEILVRHLDITKAVQVLDIVAQYYPNERIPAKTQFGVEEIIERIGGRQEENDGV